jgi:phosphoglycolate phosphatase
MPPRVVLFDLDGTLTESAPGIVNSVARALDAVGAPALERDVLLRFIGPPLIGSLRDIAGMDDEQLEAALIAYRDYFAERGMFENSVYDGIPELLQELVDDGRRLAVTTAKPLSAAAPIVEHFNLSRFFEAVCGPATDGVHETKSAVIADALAQLNVAPSPDVVLVGDRAHDVEAARATGISCVGALWGYGSREELANADELAADVQELAVLLGVKPSVGEEARA